jgi:hypothetical protein
METPAHKQKIRNERIQKKKMKIRNERIQKKKKIRNERIQSGRLAVLCC